MTWTIAMVAALAFAVIAGCVWEWLIRGRHRRHRTP
jgi:hypothetical protein